MINWKKNLIYIWLAQFFSIMGFCFALPFAPYYIQDLGVTDSVAVKMWTAAFASAAPLTLAVFSPIWGIIADRYGRKPMLLRAYFGGTIVLALMGMVSSVEQLIALRMVQGMLTGTMTASQAMVSANTPGDRSGMALGALSGALYSGAMVGTLFGGAFAEWFGYRCAFYMSGSFLLISAFLVFFGANESFEKPKKRSLTEGLRPGLNRIWIAMPILLLFVMISFTRQFDNAMFPLLVQDIHGSLDGVSIWSGSIFALAGLAGILSGVAMGALADRVSPAKIGRLSALFAAVAMIPQGLAHSFALLIPSRFMMALFAGGIDPVFQIWLAKATPADQRGFIFGWSGTAKSIGWMIAPMASGALASWLGIRSIYFIGAVLMLGLSLMIGHIMKRMEKKAAS